MSAKALEKLKAKFADAVRATHAQHGDETALVDPARIVEICTYLRDDPELQFGMLIDLTCLDTLALEERVRGRFEVVYHLRSMTHGKRVRIKAAVDEGENGENPVIDSVTGVWKGANWFEREAWDMYGIKFRNHPDLRRILLYEEFVGHPLRKDYPKEKRQPLVRRDFSS
jgi:NADH-quinone oxidoreductase subunit C